MMAVMRSLMLLFFVFSMGSAEGDSSKKCPYGWTNLGVKCYKYFSQAVNFAAAEKSCQSQDANLASVHSKLENDFLLGLVPGTTRCWIGAHDGIQEGQWFWTDGSFSDYTNWCSTEPNGGVGENCVLINWTSAPCWVDFSCFPVASYICAKDL